MGDNGGQITLRYPLHSEGLGRLISLLKLIVFSSLRLESITAIRRGLDPDEVVLIASLGQDVSRKST